ncbi:MAG: phosphoribosylformylglycinamidine synthase subunit PurS [Dehalococcoidia bacterium]
MATTYLARIDVMLKPLVNDPQGLAVRDGLHELGFGGVRTVRVGKHIEVTIEAESAPAAEGEIDSMCRKLLSNGVIEMFSFTVAPAQEAVAAS